jgi:hypothetical protein
MLQWSILAQSMRERVAEVRSQREARETPERSPSAASQRLAVLQTRTPTKLRCPRGYTLDKQTEKNRGCDKVFEPAGLTVSREYEIPWKKQPYDIAELARLRFEEGLGSRLIAARLGIPRSTAIAAVHRLERAKGFT